MDLSRKFAAEFLGTFWLVFAGCGSALLAAGFLTADKVHLGIGFAGVSLAFGLTVVSMAYGIGHISGAHLNPAVTLGLFLGGRVSVVDVVPYIVAQCVGAVLAAFLLLAICNGAPNYDVSTYAGVCNGFGEHSPGQYSLLAAFLTDTLGRGIPMPAPRGHLRYSNQMNTNGRWLGHGIVKTAESHWQAKRKKTG